MLKVLESGHPLAIGVEGTRSREGQLIKGTEGTAYLARKTDVPIIPVGVVGTEKVLKSPPSICQHHHRKTLSIARKTSPNTAILKLILNASCVLLQPYYPNGIMVIIETTP